MAKVVEVEESRMRVERRPEGLHLGLRRRHPWWHCVTPVWFLPIFGPILAFDYGSRTVRIGDLEEAEAKRVVAALNAEGLA